MRVIYRKDGWFIEGLPDEPDTVGPYGTRQEAKEIMRGLERFDRHEDNRKFFTSDKKEK